MDDAARDAYLVSSLGNELYASFYCRGRPVPARFGEPAPLAPDLGLAAALSRANAGGGSWQAGWIVERIAGADAVVRSDVRARVPLPDCRAATASSRVRRSTSASPRSTCGCRLGSTRR